jgi:hypothetical protein
MNRIFSLIALSVVTGGLLTGCASSGSSKETASVPSSGSPPLPGGVTLTKDKQLQGVWLKPGFNFSGKPSLTIEPTVYKAIERENEAAMRAFAVKELRSEEAKEARETGLFSGVFAEDNGTAPTNAPALRLVNTIYQYEKGGGGARYWAGFAGGGQPVIRVRGEMFDSNNDLVFVYDAKRSGEKVSARLAGVFQSDEEIQRADIHDLAIDLADYMMTVAGLTPPKR